MKQIVTLITAFSIILNPLLQNVDKENNHPRIIDAYILAYDTIYNADKEESKDYIILDMESIYFTDTTYEDRELAIEHFNKYNKTIANASLFKLQQIGLADKLGRLKINAYLLMLTNVTSDSDDGIIIEGSKWMGPVGAYQYRIRMKIINGKWSVIENKLLGVS